MQPIWILDPADIARFNSSNLRYSCRPFWQLFSFLGATASFSNAY